MPEVEPKPLPLNYATPRRASLPSLPQRVAAFGALLFGIPMVGLGLPILWMALFGKHGDADFPCSVWLIAVGSLFCTIGLRSLQPRSRDGDTDE